MDDDRKLAKHGPTDVDAAGRIAGPEITNVASSIVRSTADELTRLLDTQNVVGQPMVFGSTTVIPLVSMGFGFGGGGGGGASHKEAGQGGGGGGGGGVKPIALIIVDENGVRLAPIPEAPSGIEKLGGAIAGILEKRNEKEEGTS